MLINNYPQMSDTLASDVLRSFFFSYVWSKTVFANNLISYIFLFLVFPQLNTGIAIRADGSLDIKVYSEPTYNNMNLDYTSNNPTSHIKNTAISLKKRAFAICSDEGRMLQDLSKVSRDLK